MSGIGQQFRPLPIAGRKGAAAAMQGDNRRHCARCRRTMQFGTQCYPGRPWDLHRLGVRRSGEQQQECNAPDQNRLIPPASASSTAFSTSTSTAAAQVATRVRRLLTKLPITF